MSIVGVVFIVACITGTVSEGALDLQPPFKLNLLFLDRIGIVADISRCIAEQAMNIVSMEVERKQEMADV